MRKFLTRHPLLRVRSVNFFCHWIIINFWSSGFYPVGYRTHPGSWMDPVDAFFWVYRTHRNIKSSGSSKIHWIWYLAFSKIWQNMDIYHPVDKIQWIKSSGFFCPSSGLGRSTGCLPNALYIYIRSIVIYSQYCYMFVVLLHECVIMMREGICICIDKNTCVYDYYYLYLLYYSNN